MGRTEDPVLSYLDDTLAMCVGTLRRLSLLSAFIDDEKALEYAKEIRKMALETRRATIEWRRRRREVLEPPRAMEE